METLILRGVCLVKNEERDKMVRQRTKRWGFDYGGEYNTGIAKQELDESKERALLIKTKPIPLSKVKKLKKFRNPEDTVAIINPIR